MDGGCGGQLGKLKVRLEDREGQPRLEESCSEAGGGISYERYFYLNHTV